MKGGRGINRFERGLGGPILRVLGEIEQLHERVDGFVIFAVLQEPHRAVVKVQRPILLRPGRRQDAKAKAGPECQEKNDGVFQAGMGGERGAQSVRAICNPANEFPGVL